jgi:hypothetical protein
MAFKKILDDNGELRMMMCGSSWGIGMWDDPHYGLVYGFPPAGGDPRRFTPDEESCLPEEIAAWKAAIASVS